jgi:hypothetical protein
MHRFEGEGAPGAGEEVHAFEIAQDLGRTREEDGLLDVLEHAKLADLKEPHHAVGVDEGNVAEVDLVRADEELKGLFECLFGKLDHGEKKRNSGDKIGKGRKSFSRKDAKAAKVSIQIKST